MQDAKPRGSRCKTICNEMRYDNDEREGARMGWREEVKGALDKGRRLRKPCTRKVQYI